jgi:hypothetical protein
MQFAISLWNKENWKKIERKWVMEVEAYHGRRAIIGGRKEDLDQYAALPSFFIAAMVGREPL